MILYNRSSASVNQRARPVWPDHAEEANYADTVILLMLIGILFVCFGLLLGSTWTIQALRPRLCHQAEERRKLNEEWAALRTAHEKQQRCPRCGIPLDERYWYIAPAIVNEPLDDD